MKTPITVRIEAELLDAARRCAREENRTLTNFIETLLRQRVNASTHGSALPVASSPAPGGTRGKDNSHHAG